MILKKFLGLLLIVTAVIGIVFCITGLFKIWQVQPELTQAASDNLTLMDETLAATQDGLTLLGQVVNATSTDVASLQTTTQALATTLHDTTPMLDSLSSLSGKDLPDAISATQTSLASAQSSAQVIDTALGVLTSIPFSPIPYNPQVPLHTSLAGISTSLNTIPTSLATIHNSLNAGKTNLGLVEAELVKISDTVRGISDNLASTQKSIEQYKTVTAKLKARVEATQLAAPDLIKSCAWALTFALAWLLISQLGLLIQGFDLLWGSHVTNHRQ
jgi:hypothetical protein